MAAPVLDGWAVVGVVDSALFFLLSEKILLFSGELIISIVYVYYDNVA